MNQELTATPSRSFVARARDALGRVYVRVTRQLEGHARVRRAANEVSAGSPRSLDAALDYAYTARPGFLKIAPNQVRSELHDFLLRVRDVRPRAVLEIGTGLGGTLFLLTRVAAPDAILVSIDLASGDVRFGGGKAEQRRPLFEAFALEGQRVHFLTGDSHAVDMRARVEDKLHGRELDVLFIDGDHTEHGVRSDFELYRDLVRRGGLIAFHDIVDGPPNLVGDVPRFWQRIKTPDSQEVVADRLQGGYGIGVLQR